jgi:hypothetical protein
MWYITFKTAGTGYLLCDSHLRRKVSLSPDVQGLVFTSLISTYGILLEEASSNGVMADEVKLKNTGSFKQRHY